MKHIRMATAAEIDEIRPKADLMPDSTYVLALDADRGSPDLAVVRRCVEVNPVVYGSETTDARRVRFIYALEERLLGAGVDRYYSQFDSSKTDYLKVMENWGFERVSSVPEYRYLRIIK
jgi:hypothetical protein